MINDTSCDDIDPNFGEECDDETTQELLVIFEEFTEYTIQKYASQNKTLITENEIMTLLNDDDDEHIIFNENHTHGNDVDDTTKPAGNSTYG